MREMGTVPTILTSSQVRASAIALRGDVLAQVVGGELRTYDARTLTRTETRDLAPRHFCFARDGALVVYSYPPGSNGGTLYRIGPSRNLETYTAPIQVRGGWNVVLPGKTASDFFVAQDERIFPLRLIDGRVERGQDLSHPRPFDGNRQQLVPRDDGSIVAPEGAGLRVVMPDGTGVSYSMKGRSFRHLAGASGDRVWYTHAPGNGGQQQLFLAKITTPLAEEHVVDLSPLRITNLASGGGAAAVIGVQLVSATEARMDLIVIGEDGNERWRAPLPRSGGHRLSPWTGHLALDDKRVVFSMFDGTLFGWGAATGKPLA